MCVSVAILLNHFAISPASAIVSPQSCKYEVQTCKAKLEKFQLRFARRTTAVPIT